MMTMRDYGPGICERCGIPVYWPQYQRPGFEGCQCASPDLFTWEQWDAEYAPPPPQEPPTVEPGTVLRIRQGGFWKKRASRL